jgi:Biotin carboxylase
MKKLMSLGGNYYQMTAVKAAKRLGYHVIDVDFLPDNPAHAYADEYYNISTLDKENVLKLAKKLKIDGIISYASDVSAPTAAYVAEKLELPTNPYESVYLMTRKDLFHPFLKKHNFYVPNNTKICDENGVLDFWEKHEGDILIKPVSSSGSKGITRLSEKSQIKRSIQEAKKYAGKDDIIVEEFIERDSYQIAGDAFILNGKIEVFGLANEHFDAECNPLVPIGESFPVFLTSEKIERAKNEIQRAVSLLKLQNGAINLDFMFTKAGKIFIIELGPRNGGNLISDAIKYASEIDLAEYTVKVALGENITKIKDFSSKRNISSYIWHSKENGRYDSIMISDELKKKIIKSDMFVQKGEPVYYYGNSGFGLGAAILEFKDQNEMLYMMGHMNEYYKIKLL